MRSCPFCPLENFEHVQNLERTQTDDGIRWMYVSYLFCPLLVRFLFCTCPVLICWCPVDPIRNRTSTGHVTDQTEVFRTYAACRTNKTDKERTETDIERRLNGCPLPIGPIWWRTRLIRELLCSTLSIIFLRSFVNTWSAVPEPGYSIERHCSRQRWISWMQIFILLLMNKTDEGGADSGDGGLGHGWVQRDDCSLVFMTNLWWSYGEKTRGHLWTSCGCLPRCLMRSWTK